MSAPVEHLHESLKLEAEPHVDLFEIRLKSTALRKYFWNGPTRVWQGITWEGNSCQLTGEKRATDGQQARPSLTVVNPENVFGVFAAEGYFDLAEVIRKRVLQPHFEANVNLFEQRVWIVGRPSQVTDKVMSLELRSPIDMPAWRTPRRTYNPNDGYPFVVL